MTIWRVACVCYGGVWVQWDSHVPTGVNYSTPSKPILLDLWRTNLGTTTISNRHETVSDRFSSPQPARS